MDLEIDWAFLPATLTAPPMNDDEFAAFCADHTELFFEVTADGVLIVMPPTSFDIGASNCRISSELGNWAEADGRGVVTASSTGFVLPNGAPVGRRSVDVL